MCIHSRIHIHTLIHTHPLESNRTFSVETNLPSPGRVIVFTGGSTYFIYIYSMYVYVYIYIYLKMAYSATQSAEVWVSPAVA